MIEPEVASRARVTSSGRGNSGNDLPDGMSVSREETRLLPNLTTEGGGRVRGDVQLEVKQERVGGFMSLCWLQKDASIRPIRQVKESDSFAPLDQSHAVATFPRQASDRPCCMNIMAPAECAPSRYTKVDSATRVSKARYYNHSESHEPMERYTQGAQELCFALRHIQIYKTTSRYIYQAYALLRTNLIPVSLPDRWKESMMQIHRNRDV